MGVEAECDQVYGMAMLDLSTDAAVVTVDPLADHYWCIQFFDNYARWWHMTGSQFDTPSPIRRLLADPNWTDRHPDGFLGAEIVQAPSDFSGVGARIAEIDDTDANLETVRAAQDGITLMPLTAWIASGRTTVMAADVPIVWPGYPNYPGMETVVEPGRLSQMEFLRWVGCVLQDPTFTEQHDGHREIVAFSRFERVGLNLGAPFDPDRLPKEIADAIEAGIEEAKKDVLSVADVGFGIERNGWIFFNDIGYRDTDWRLRAFYGLTAILTPVPSASHNGAFCFNDSRNRPLSGQHRYTTTFRMDDLPPVSEFWEIPLDDTNGYLYDNPLDRHTINSDMLAAGKLHIEDGKLMIYVQRDEPANPMHRRNWLPAPARGFEFAERFYGPATPVIDGSYDMPGVVRGE